MSWIYTNGYFYIHEYFLYTFAGVIRDFALYRDSLLVCHYNKEIPRKSDIQDIHTQLCTTSSFSSTMICMSLSVRKVVQK